ncbi:MAG: DUF4442 domain-containing protein [Proteobacteria bacterium]|nr:DUF4442 domain-containing protein [Pseudomonadota bacterium]
MIEERYKTLAEFSVSLVEGIKRTGIRVIGLRDRYAKILMPLEGNVNHVGMMYAGSLFTIGEFSGGIIHGVSFDVKRFVPIVKEVTIRFQSPATTDVTLEVSLGREEADRIQAEAEENGKADFALELEIKDAGGETVSLVKGLWQIRKMPEEMKGALDF